MTQRFTWTGKDAKAIMNSPAVQRQVRRRGELGVAAFRRAAPRRTGDFARNVRLEPARFRDGRKGYRLVAFPSRTHAPVPINFGTSDTRPARATAAAIRAIEGKHR